MVQHRVTSDLPGRSRARSLAAFLVSAALVVVVGTLGGLSTASSVATWYSTLHKPAFNPPNAVFGPVWSLLYLMMAVAAWRVWRRPGSPGRRPALALYAFQLGLNLGWSCLFFGLRQPGWALGEIGVLLAFVLGTAAAFARLDRLAGLLLIPYAAWVAFAAALTFEIWRLN